jgi:hypothetical protein
MVGRTWGVGNDFELCGTEVDNEVELGKTCCVDNEFEFGRTGDKEFELGRTGVDKELALGKELLKPLLMLGKAAAAGCNTVLGGATEGNCENV